MVVVWVPLANPGGSKMWIQGPSVLDEGAGKKSDGVTGAREQGSMWRWRRSCAHVWA